MTPTARLRFVTRDLLTGEHFQVQPTHKVLQQWWAVDPDCYEDFLMQVNGAWFDVEMGKE